MPDESELLNPGRDDVRTADDVLGRRITRGEVERMKATGEGRAALTPAAGAVAIDSEMVWRGAGCDPSPIAPNGPGVRSVE